MCVFVYKGAYMCVRVLSSFWVGMCSFLCVCVQRVWGGVREGENVGKNVRVRFRGSVRQNVNVHWLLHTA